MFNVTFAPSGCDSPGVTVSKMIKFLCVWSLLSRYSDSSVHVWPWRFFLFVVNLWDSSNTLFSICILLENVLKFWKIQIKKTIYLLERCHLWINDNIEHTRGKIRIKRTDFLVSVVVSFMAKRSVSGTNLLWTLFFLIDSSVGLFLNASFHPVASWVNACFQTTHLCQDEGF